MMNPPPIYLRNYQALMEAFGYWPSFHDAVILAYSQQADVIELLIHYWKTNREADCGGYYKCTDHHCIRFAFTSVFDCSPEHPEPHDVLFEVSFSCPSELAKQAFFEVTLHPATGHGIAFSALLGEVIEVISCDELGVISQDAISSTPWP